jgi:UV DNA damage repair endonuclease
MQDIFLIQTTAHCRESSVSNTVKPHLVFVCENMLKASGKPIRTLQAKRYMDLGEQDHDVLGLEAFTSTLGCP